MWTAARQRKYHREWARRKRATNPEPMRAANRKYMRKYRRRKGMRELLRKKGRAYYWKNRARVLAARKAQYWKSKEK